MKTSAKPALGIALVFMFLGIANAVADPQTVIDDSKDRAYLFTMSATSGSFAKERLTLNGVPLIVYFTDRPHRESGHMSLADFLKLWQGGTDSFNKDPPNAELAIYEAGDDAHSVLIIDQPEVGEESISFHVAILDEVIPETFSHATLFIDAFPCPVNGCLLP